MAYTVKQVAKMSGVSVRTLHFYDETGLLRPARVGANGYRFYEEPQLLALQQILFYRELGFELKRIKEILGRKNFEIVSALESHRKILERDATRTRRLIATIDKTIEHLKGGKKMKSEEMFVGFSVARGADRFGESIKLGGPGGEPHDCKVSARDTGGAFCIFEANGFSAGPRHLHFEQDEWMYVLAGEFIVELGKEKKRLHLRAGESVFIPRKTPHAWAAANGELGRVLTLFQPAGTMEEFYHELGRVTGGLGEEKRSRGEKAKRRNAPLPLLYSSPPLPSLKPGVLPTVEQVKNRSYTAAQVKGLHEFFAAHGMDLLGPPLGFE